MLSWPARERGRCPSRRRLCNRPSVTSAERGVSVALMQNADSPPPPLPEWLMAALTRRKVSTLSDNLAPLTVEDHAAIEEELASALLRVREAPEGTRNDALNRNAFLIGKMVGAGAVQHSIALERLTEAALAAGLDPIEARRTAESGLRAGMKRPWTPRASDAVLNRINQDHFFALLGHVGFVLRE